MKYLVNSREMKLFDKNTTEHFKIPSIVLMERAACAFVDTLRVHRIDAARTLLVCGVGNNGGDGLAIARLLLLAGHSVDVVLCGDRKKATEANRLQQSILKAYDCPVSDEIPDGRTYTLVVDALFGVGLSRGIEGSFSEIIERMNTLSGTKAAVDIASGISADTGSVLGTAFRADITVTFAYGKAGMLLWPGSEYSGKIVVADIGIDEHSWLDKKPSLAAMEHTELALLPARPAHSNKGTYGKLLVIAGSVNMAGAAFLSAKAAYAAGCGLVRIVTPEENRAPLQTMLPEAILTTYSAKKPERQVILEAIKWADVIVCGPGIGVTEASEQLVKTVLKDASVPVLLDADALNLIAKDVNILLGPHTELVLTPHLGEMSRLGGDSVSYIQTKIIEVAEEFARQYNVICVLKDARTVTAIPYGQTYLNLSGNSGMATAGSGDVLSGIIGGLMAQGLAGEIAAPLGVYLHGMAGDAAAEQTGGRSLMASDIIEGIRTVLCGTDKEGEKTRNEQI